MKRILAISKAYAAAEYIRFFYLDWLWLEYLRKGALSLRCSTRITDESMSGLAKPSWLTTGFRLRSEVVAGWPDLLVDGYTISPDGTLLPIKLLRMDTLANDILICLFDGKPDAIDFQGRSFRVPQQAQKPKPDGGPLKAADFVQMAEPEEKVRFKLG